MKKSILSAPLLFAALAFTSCLNNDGENKSEATVTYGGSYCFNYVTDMQTGESFISTEPQYSFLLNYTDMLITPSMSNIKTSENGSSLSFKLPALEVSTSSQDYSYTCSGTDLIPEGQGQAYVFDRFSFKVIDRALKTSSGSYIYSPVYDIAFCISSRYNVVVFPTRYDLLGTTTATADGATDSYSNNEPIYSISVDPKTNLASIAINDARFAAEHSGMKIGVEKVPCTITSSGITIATEPGEKFQLKDLAGNVEGAYLSDINLRINVPSGIGSNISFHANITGLQGNSGTDYDVTASLSYYVPASNN